MAHLSLEDSLETFNVLIISTKLDLDNDIPHRLVFIEATGSLAGICEMDLCMKDYAKVNIINPATFTALQAQLETKKPGNFNLVHLDYHGIEDDSEWWVLHCRRT
jgi:hypothetical protein